MIDVSQAYIDILKEELVPAMGCTEPIALSYAGSVAADILGEPVKALVAKCSGNIIKNVKSVKVPNTDGLIGIEAAVIAGALAGDSSLKLEVISKLKDEDRKLIRKALNQNICKAEYLDSPIPLHIIVEAYGDVHHSCVEITHSHTNIANMYLDDKKIDQEVNGYVEEQLTDRSLLTVAKIVEFANTVDLELVKDMLEEQIECNMNIAKEGFTGKYGVNIGKVLLDQNPNDLETKMMAYAASASEARMEGCPLPVITNSGSGNQGITASIPVVVYCQEKGLSKQTLYRALLVSNLITIHCKTGIGRLSAFCGAVCAGTAIGAALTFLQGGTEEQIDNTIRNSFANVTGIICDGAKATCGIKITSALQSGFLASKLALMGKTYDGGTGILKNTVEDTIRDVGILGKDGMHETDKVILNLMMKE